LDESGRFAGYASMTSEVGAVSIMPWMEEHCSPVGAAFEIKHHTTYFHTIINPNPSDELRTGTTIHTKNFLTGAKPIRFGHDGQEISAKEAQTLIDEFERYSGPENADRRAAELARGDPPFGRGRGRGRGGRGRGERGGFRGGFSPRSRPFSRGRGRGDSTPRGKGHWDHDRSGFHP
jgi:hypothetical protein